MEYFHQNEPHHQNDKQLYESIWKFQTFFARQMESIRRTSTSSLKKLSIKLPTFSTSFGTSFLQTILAKLWSFLTYMNSDFYIYKVKKWWKSSPHSSMVSKWWFNCVFVCSNPTSDKFFFSNLWEKIGKCTRTVISHILKLAYSTRLKQEVQ